MPTPSPDLSWISLRGGYNDTDPLHQLKNDECSKAENVEWFNSMLGERRLGTASLSLTSSGLTALAGIGHLSEWFPTNVQTAPEYWGIAVTDGVSVAVARRDTGGTWHVVSPADAVNTSAADVYQIRSQALDGLLFFPYHSGQNRMHVWDTSSLRRSGLAAPAAMLAGGTYDGANGSGLWSGTRFFRFRYTRQVAGVTVLRSEPSPVQTAYTSGFYKGYILGPPPALGESETHWELEASTDNANFYRIGTATIASMIEDSITNGAGYPAVTHAAPTSTDGTAITYVLLSNAAALLNLTGVVANGTYGNPATNIAGRGWIGYDGAGVYIPNTNSFVWSSVQNWYASPDIAAALEAQAGGGTSQNYASVGTLSEAIGAYLTLPSAKYTIVDGDRLVYAGHWTDTTQMSTVGWTPAKADPGVGNAERAPIVTTGGTAIVTTRDLDNYDGGPITGLATVTLGRWYAFKWQRIYSAVHQNDVTNEYDIQCIHTTRGAISGSVLRAADASGNTVIVFLDPNVGPCMLAADGTVTLIRGLRTTWKRVSVKATGVVCCGYFYPYKQQVVWFLSVDGGNTPSLGIRLQLSEVKALTDGTLGRGWSLITGRMAQALCATTLFATSGNFSTEIPFIGLTSPDFAQQCDTGTDDNGTAFTGTIISAPQSPATLTSKFGIAEGTFLGTADATASVALSLIRDAGVETTSPGGNPISLAPVGSETQVEVRVDDLRISEARMVQLEITDGQAGHNWQAQRVDAVVRPEGHAV